MRVKSCREKVDPQHESPKENLDQYLLHQVDLFLHWRAFLGENTSMHDYYSPCIILG